MKARAFVALMGLTLAVPVHAQIADRLPDRARSGYASGGVAYYGAGPAACTRYGWNGSHAWFDFGWPNDIRYDRRYDGRGDDRYDDWDDIRDDAAHRSWRSLERERVRCAEWIRSGAVRGPRFDRDHARMHERLAREHREWHRKNDRRPHNRGWFRGHESLHDRLAWLHDQWHRDLRRDWERDRDRYDRDRDRGRR
ncbi:MAG: hypothetical protein L0271_24325 [Gemmatimonadetes bacterium]|nr:hypothetical protein [Gemmatimonadota bacterium]